eukprot:4176259-Alexandrium_andersonii.AAC.1
MSATMQSNVTRARTVLPIVIHEVIRVANLMSGITCVRTAVTAGSRLPARTATGSRRCCRTRATEAVSYTHLTLPTICSV